MSLYSDYELTPAPEGPMSQSFGTLKPYSPTLGERIGAGFANAMDWLRGSSSRQGWQNANEISQSVAGLIPGLGQATSASDAYKGYLTGDTPRAIMGAIGAVPIPGAAMETKALKNVVESAAEPIGGRVLTEAGTPGILAYHGSPHSFDKFSMGNIGTGEGSQVYGHGLYFAEHPEVAETYRTSGMSPNNVLDSQGNVVDFDLHQDLAHRIAHSTLANAGGNYGDALKEVSQVPTHVSSDVQENWRQAPNILKNWQDQGYSTAPKVSSKYQVSIGEDPDKFLHFNKPYNEQPSNVQKAFQKLMPSARLSEFGTGEDMHQALQNQMVDKLGVDDDAAAAIASKALRGEKVPGIKYFDQESRPGVDNPTHNYVLFSDKNINILKKYGLAGMGAAVGLHALANHPDADSYQMQEMKD